MATFKPQEPTGGIVGGAPTVLLDDGKKLKLAKSLGKRPRDNPAHSRVSKGRMQILNNTLRQRDVFKSRLAKAHRDFAARERQADARRDKKGEVPKAEQRRAKATAKKIAVAVVKDAENKLRQNVLQAANREAANQAIRLRQLGITPPPQREITALIRRTVRDTLAAPYPGTGVALRERLGVVSARVTSLLMLPVEASARRRNTALIHAEKGLTETRPGRVRVPGGSAVKQLERLNRTEQARIMREISLALARTAGVEFIYWRLSGSHKSYGGGEVCERIAASTGPGVAAALKAQGVSGADLQGLFTAAGYPVIPHANCMCTQEYFSP